MTKAEKGDTVAIHYTGTLNDGTRFDSSEGREPLSFELGSGQIIAGLDAAIQGMDEGAEKTVTIPSDEAYGAHNPQQVQTVPRTDIPEDIPVEPGLQLQAKTQDGSVVPLVVTKVEDGMVTLDANHPLAGEDLTFAFTLISVKKAA
ncbi:FKBP-type peptidyl-prolyl cis-trans isomerase [Pontivivens ytuae]|uniref:Peptidyl-prolyl cis-trans isomerase n=1 Tax=Pontivivens ytuae TaxID=2789856 RepID=A0A7S9LSA0_9RHOB|nr:peptidylprolyl isomerase [Pontivivens ytuae]QPH54025.1 peptidylprolyl isomerase [Pontivivens ytuae]